MGDMINFIFNGFSAFNALGFLVGGVMMLGIGLAFVGWWVYWRLSSYRVRGTIVGIKSTGVKRSDEVWREECLKDAEEARRKEQTQPGFFEGMRADFKEKPGSSIGVYFLVFLICLVPVVFFLVGSWNAYNFLSLRYGGIEVSAKVVNYDTSYDSESGTSYYPVVVFSDRQGRSHRLKSKMGGGARPYKLGAAVTVFYDRYNPERFVINNFWQYMLFSFAFMGIGGGIIGWVLWHWYMQKSGKAYRRKVTVTPRKIDAKKRAYYTQQRYYPVYEFMTPGGGMVRADGKEDGNNWIAHQLPGRKVRLMVRQGGEDKKSLSVKRPGIMLLVFGLIFVAPGLLFLDVALAGLSFGLPLLAVLAFLFMGLVFKLVKVIKPARAALKEIWAARGEIGDGEGIRFKVDDVPDTAFLLDDQEIAERLRVLDGNAYLIVPVLLFFGLALTFGGYKSFQETNDLSSRAMVAQGEIVGMNSRSDSDGGYMYYPVVAFETAQGKRMEFEGRTGTNPPAYQTGRKVLVLYDPENPRRAMIDKGWMNWILPGGLALVGLLMVLFSLKMLAGVMIRSRQRRHRVL